MRREVWGLFLAAALAVGAPQQQDIGYDLNDRGVDASQRGDHETAIRLLDEAIQFWRLKGPAYDPAVATALYNKAEAQCGLGKWKESVANFEESVALMRKSRGDRNLRTVRYENALANAYLMLGERGQSEIVFRRVLEVERQDFPDSEEVAHTLAGLSSVATREGRLSDALPMADEALRIGIASLGEKRPETATLYANVAQIHALMGHTERAMPLYRKARAIYDATLPPDNPRIGLILSQEGQAYLLDGKRALAEKDLRDAIDHLRHCPACGVELAVAENHLAGLRMRQNRFVEAAELLTDAMSVEERFHGRPGAETAATLELLSKIRTQEKRFDDAARLHERAQTILSYR